MRIDGPDAIVSEILEQLHERRRKAIDAAKSLDATIAEREEQARDRMADAGALLVPARDRWLAPDAVSQDLVEADRIVARIAKIDRRLGRWGVLRHRRGRDVLHEERMRRSAELRQILIRIATGAGFDATDDVPDVRFLFEQAARHRAEASELRRKALSLQIQIAQIDRDVARHGRRQADRHVERIRTDLDGRL